jgi:hypothetical protein
MACIVGETGTGAASATVNLEEGMGYKILAYTEADSTDLVNPSLNVQSISVGQGDVCSQAFTFTDGDLPFTLSGSFTVDGPIGGSCDTSPNNVAWAQYTAETSGAMTFSALLSDSEAKARLAVYEGAQCDPVGAELACEASSTNGVSTAVSVVEGSVYSIAVYTDSEDSLNDDPVLSIEPFSADPGHHCLSALDVTDLTMPLAAETECPEGSNCGALIGEFDDDPAVGSTCDSTPTNAAWFRFTPSSGGNYKISLSNKTETFAYSRGAIFEGTDCGVLATPVVCATEFSKNMDLQAELEAGKTYTILFYMDGDTYTMLDSMIEIKEIELVMGGTCNTIAEIPVVG